MKNTFFAINSCFSTEIYDEKYLYQKLENIYSFADNYLDISSKIYLQNYYRKMTNSILTNRGNL